MTADLVHLGVRNEPFESSCLSDTLIIGGGIIGLSLAWELAGRGLSVRVLDSQACGSAASWAGVGILPPVATREVNDPLEQLRSLSHSLLAQWATELTELTGIDTGYRTCGGVYVATTLGEAAMLAASRSWWEELGIDAVAWSAEQLRLNEPALASLAESGRLKAIWSLPGECQLRTPWYVRALAAACKLRGVDIVEDCPANQLVMRDDRITGVETTSGCFKADKYCLTAGPWTSALLESIGVASGILPVRGQVMLFHPHQRLLTRIINEGHRYLVSRDDGRILVGSNEEEVGFQCETTDEILEELRAWAIGLLPELAQANLERAWAGLRPGSFDSYPYIGGLPTCRNAFVAAGHFRAGIHLSAGTARVLADLITTGRSTIDLSPFRAARG
ncbi:MAG: glycine oxidase ThiO [Pirellulaceae bacterium]|nr:glycine oxidase ThiO [Pirellulaceae bacterium]